jgi:hypothetical protein
MSFLKEIPGSLLGTEKEVSDVLSDKQCYSEQQIKMRCSLWK